MKFSTNIGVPETDFNLISDLVETYSYEQLPRLQELTRRLFNGCLTISHFTVLGLLLGERLATNSNHNNPARQNQNKQLSLWQKQRLN